MTTTRTTAATKAAARKAQEARAEYLRERGWICLAPDTPVCTHYDRDPKRVRRLELDAQPLECGCG